MQSCLEKTPIPFVLETLVTCELWELQFLSHVLVDDYRESSRVELIWNFVFAAACYKQRFLVFSSDFKEYLVLGADFALFQK